LRKIRGNGTPLARNDAQAEDFSLQVNRTLKAINGSARFDLYFQDRRFYSQFTAVQPGRNEERASLEQFDVPGQALGSAFNIEGETEAGLAWLFGADARQSEGSTHERYRNLGEGFTRMRRAGGEQEFLGLYGKFNYTVHTRLSIEGSLRWDDWSIRDAFRREFDLATNEALRRDRYPDRDGTFTGGNLGITYQFSSDSSLSLHAFRGFRLPTINELYRPFRVGNDITEANPDLKRGSARRHRSHLETRIWTGSGAHALSLHLCLGGGGGQCSHEHRERFLPHLRIRSGWRIL
jgi:outer membrane receptor protein involved in Fe transport